MSLLLMFTSGQHTHTRTKKKKKKKNTTKGSKWARKGGCSRNCFVGPPQLVLAHRAQKVRFCCGWLGGFATTHKERKKATKQTGTGWCCSNNKIPLSFSFCLFFFSLFRFFFSFFFSLRRNRQRHTKASGHETKKERKKERKEKARKKDVHAHSRLTVYSRSLDNSLHITPLFTMPTARKAQGFAGLVFKKREREKRNETRLNSEQEGIHT